MQPINQLLKTIAQILEEITRETDQMGIEQRSMFHASHAPSISIQNYLQRISKYSHCSSSSFIIALIYLDKLQEMHTEMILNSKCVHRFIIVSIMVAIKYYEDDYYKNEYYAKIGGISLSEINQLEQEFLELLNYELFIQNELYNTYCDKLKEYEEIEI